MEAIKLNYMEKRDSPRKKVNTSVPVVLKSKFSNVVYRKFQIKNYSLSGAWIEFHYDKKQPEYILFPLLVNKYQKDFIMYCNLLKHININKDLKKIPAVSGNNLWMEIPCKITRYKKEKSSFGLGLEFITS